MAHGFSEVPKIELRKRGPNVEVYPSADDLLLPEPPIGQRSPQEIMAAGKEQLASMASERGFATEELFSKEDMEAKWRRDWSEENRMRLALMYLEGTPLYEVAEAFKPTRRPKSPVLTEDAVERDGKRILSEAVRTLADRNRLVRKWHAFMSPESPDIEDLVKALTLKADMPRNRLFQMHRAAEESTSARTRRKKSIYDPAIAIQVLHMRFVEKLGPKTIAERASSLVGYPLSVPAVGQLYAKVLSEEGAIALGIRTQAARRQNP